MNNQDQDIKKVNIIQAFFLNRLKWAKETIFWLGIILIIGFVRVNFYADAELRVHFPEYISYDVFGNPRAQVGKLEDYRGKK